MIDVLVIGAGPAGSFLATLLARRGLAVCLVDRARFPRWTVCGACLSGLGVAQLREEGMESVLDDAGALPLGRLEIRGWGRRARFPLLGGRVLSRAALDLNLMEAARSAGARGRTETLARLGRWTGAAREVELVGPGGRAELCHARVVVAATGLHSLPRLPGAGAEPGLEHDPGSHVGVGAVVTGWDDGPLAGTVRMSVGDGGYVGQVLQEDGSWVVAGALAPAWLRKRGGPGPAVTELLASTGVGTSWHVREGWRGTPSLTRRRPRRAEAGVFYLGDAAGYVEPFTGEGMGWALRGARELAGLVEEAVSGWSRELEALWDRRYLARVGALQRLCRGVAWLGRRPDLARGAIALLSWAPRLALPAVRRVAGLTGAASGPPVSPPSPGSGLAPPSRR